MGILKLAMSKDASFEWLLQQLGQVLKRIERCEGKIAQLEAGALQPALRFPSRRELQGLEKRLDRLEEQ